MAEKVTRRKSKTTYIYENEEIVKLPEESKKSEILFKTTRQLFSEYFYTHDRFKIYSGSELIFDTKYNTKNQINLLSDGVKIFQKVYSYNGIQIK